MVQLTKQRKKLNRGGAIPSKIFMVIILCAGTIWVQLLYSQKYHMPTIVDSPSQASSDFLPPEWKLPKSRAEIPGRIQKREDGNRIMHETTEQCRIYLAPSSVSDNENRPAGFGVFTTVPLPKGSYIFPRGEGPSVIIPDVATNNFGSEPNWAQYIFLYPNVGFNMETDDPNIKNKFSALESNMNLGALGNFHPYLKNVLFDDTDIYKDNLVQRSKDPGAGAFSYHMGKKWHVTRDVGAGEELFDDYSEWWFFEEELGEAAKDIPREHEYDEAASALYSFITEMDDTTVAQKDLVELKAKTRKKSRRAASLLPTNVTEFFHLWENAKTEDDLAMALARRTVNNKSPAWIRENGKCLDNVYPDVSTIAQAGQGGFAARQIAAGQTVVPVPTLLQVADKTTLNVYKHERTQNKHGKESYKSVGDKPLTQQLVLNYCFGHESSSMVLCPATNGNLINHCSSRMKWGGQCDESLGPNAELRWATEFDPETKEWLERSLEEIDERVGNGRRGLSFEIVATRDISPGEEIFIDYGEAWEKAWSDYVAQWSPPISPGYVAVADMNHNVSAFLRNEEQLEDNPYPPGVRLGCHIHGFYHPCQVLRLLDTTEPSTAGSPLERVPVYKVRVEKWKLQGVWEFKYEWQFDETTIETSLSSRYIRFFHGLYSSDQHISGTFRHSIGVPDDIWPKQWKIYKSK